ncbi:hypothetical protein OROMI_033110 [Orobanche minor]
MEKSGATDFLAALIVKKSTAIVSEDALSILYSLQLSKSNLKSLYSKIDLIGCLTKFMHYSSYKSRAYAVMLLKSMAELSLTLGFARGDQEGGEDPTIGCQFSVTMVMLQEMVQTGVVVKLCMVLQVEWGEDEGKGRRR